MSDFVHDLRYGLRQLRSSPGFFATAALLIAIGIAANTLIFTLAETLLFRSLPVRGPRNLVQLFETRPKQPASPYFDYRFYKLLNGSSSTLFDAMGQMETTRALDTGSSSERIHAYAVTENFFANLGVSAILGRGLGAGDTHAAVLSYGYWKRSFGSDPKALGQTVRLQGHPFTIVGVEPENFAGTAIDSSPDLWIPYTNLLKFSRAPNPNLDLFLIGIVTRLRPGVSEKQAQEETSALWTRYMRQAGVSDPAITATSARAGCKCVPFLMVCLRFETGPNRRCSCYWRAPACCC